MKGLLFKDIINLKKQAKILIVFAVIYMVMSFSTGNVSFLIGMMTILCTVLTITSLSYDDLANWDRYALSMPIERKTIVISKYVLGIGLCAFSAIIITLITLISSLFMKELSITETFFTLYIVSIIALIMISVCLPLMFKFGTEGGRMILLLVIGLPTILVVLLGKIGVPLPSEEFLYSLLWVLPIIVIAIMIISIMISIKVYYKKEF